MKYNAYNEEKGTNMKNNRGIEKIKQKFEEDPFTVIMIGAFAATAAAKLIDAVSAAQGRRAYANQVKLSNLKYQNR